jgi:hypothetical protein
VLLLIISPFLTKWMHIDEEDDEEESELAGKPDAEPEAA